MMRRTRQLRFSVIRSLRTLVSLIYRGVSPISFGSTDLYVQNQSPGAEKESNWLPAPTGKFILMLRMYWPNENDPSIIDGTWTIPVLRRLWLANAALCLLLAQSGSSENLAVSPP